MDPAKILKNLPMELVLIVLEQTVRVPKVHFFKLFRHYNGGLLGRPLLLPGEFDPGETGVEDVSPFSGARKLAKLTMEISAGVPHFKVDIVNDVFCFSSNGQDPFFPGQRFSGGNSKYHEALSKIHRVCVGLPNFDLGAPNDNCQDCGRNYHFQRGAFPKGGIEFCTRCIGLWFARLNNLEQVYIIIPGLPRAQGTDKQYIARYGEADTHRRVLKEALQRDPTCRVVGSSILSVNTDDVPGQVMVSHSAEGFGTSGPCSFEGDGITLYEVDMMGVSDRDVRFMNTVVKSYARTRVRWADMTSGVSPPAFPEDPRVCGGMVEFKFLSYALGP
ncbi:hypothetical protein SLS64_009485 [Diaporthe eres]